MELMWLHPELRSAYSRIPPLPFHNRLFLWCINAARRLIRRRAPSVPGLAISTHALRHASVRLYQPLADKGDGAVLWLHGGGYVLGDVSINDRECIELAQSLRITVVSVEYRLAPRHRFPAALDDALEAWQWMRDSHEQLGIEAHRIAIAGQSAGGGLAAALGQRIRDDAGVQPAAQVLIYPMLDDQTGNDRSLDALRHRLWNNHNNLGAWTFYLGQPPGSAQVPAYASPARRVSLAGLPPAWIGVGKLDLFHAESVAYADRLMAAGVPCDLHVVDGAPHGFDLIVPSATVSIEFTAAYRRFLGERLGASF